MTGKGLSEALVVRLRSDILVGRFAPGEQLSEEVIARTHGVSRETVRASLQELVRVGLVEREPYCAATVARPCPDDLFDLLELRNGLEPLLTARFVQRATPEELEQFSLAQVRFDAAIVGGDQGQIERGRDGFYGALISGAGSWALAATIEREAARLQLLRIRLLGWDFERDRLRAGAEYRRAIAPIVRRRDPAAAERMCARHLREDSALTLRAMRQREAA